MARGHTLMTYGYEPDPDTAKGTLLALGVFDDPHAQHAALLAKLATERAFVKLVLLPQHDETLHRMKLHAEQPYYERIKRLEAWVEKANPEIPVIVDAWEGKRQKYTPLDTLLQFATDKYKAPHFVALPQTYANAFASYSSFGVWIRRVRLLIMARPEFAPHPKLAGAASRWEIVPI